MRWCSTYHKSFPFVEPAITSELLEVFIFAPLLEHVGEIIGASWWYVIKQSAGQINKILLLGVETMIFFVSNQGNRWWYSSLEKEWEIIMFLWYRLPWGKMEDFSFSALPSGYCSNAVIMQKHVINYFSVLTDYLLLNIKYSCRCNPLCIFGHCWVLSTSYFHLFPQGFWFHLLPQNRYMILEWIKPLRYI